MNPLRLIPMRCSSKLPARYPDAGLHAGEEKGGLKWLQRVEHIVLSPSASRESTISAMRILFFLILLCFLLVGESQVNSINRSNCEEVIYPQGEFNFN